MRIAEAVLVMVLVFGTAGIMTWATARAVGKRWRSRREEHAPWILDEESDGELLCLYAERPGEGRLLIGSAPFAAADFEDRLYGLRAVAHMRIMALNEREL